MKLRWLSMLAVAVAAITTMARAETYAVLVGINQYQSGFKPLSYAENDARLMGELLMVSTRVPEANIRMLFGSDATRNAIGESLKSWLANRVQPTDTAIFYFSGHGSYMIDDNGDEEDGLDEALCAHDSSPLSDLSFIRDDVLDAWLQEIPCATKVAILDACHSGTGSKAIYAGGNRVKEAGINGREIALASRAAHQADEAALNRLSPRGGATVRDSRVLELAACRPDQISMESSAYKHGVLTYFVAEGARGAADANRDGTITLGELQSYAARRIKERGFAQEPQINGTDGESFALITPKTLVVEPAPPPEPIAEEAPPLPPPPPPEPALAPERVVETRGNTVVLSIGANHGVVRGAVYRVFARALLTPEGRVPDGALPAGTVRVVAIEATRSRAEFADKPFPVAANDAVRLYRRPVEPDRLVVRILQDDDTPASAETATFIDALRTEVAAIPDVRLAEEVDTPDRLLFGSIRRDTATPIAEVTLANPNRALAAEPLRLARFGSPEEAARALAEQLTPSLVAAFTKKALAALENPDSPIRIGLIGPESARIGDTVSFQFTPSHNGYLLLVNIATDGSLNVLYPNGFATHNAVRAGERVTVPDERWRIRVKGPVGLEVVKAIFTTVPIELDEVNPEALREQNLFALPASESGSLLRRIAVDILRNRPVSEWAAEAVAFPVTAGTKDPLELSSLE